MKFKARFLYCLVLPLVLITGCNDDEPTSQNASINKWIYGEMSFWYFWTDNMRNDPDYRLSPDLFYKSLLDTADHFSFYSKDYETLINALSGVSLESGFEFKLYIEEESSSNMIMQLSYIKQGSPADQYGLRRGDIIYEINDQQLTETNYRQLLSAMNTSYSASYRRFDKDAAAFEEQGRLTINPVTYAENPVFLDSIYEVNGRKIGYLVYNFFASGPASGGSQYDDQLDDLFMTFYNQGIDEFILDLRFNSGGSETSARKLASLMVKNASAGDLMFKKQYNANVEHEILSDKDLGADFLLVRFDSEPGNIGQTIQSNTIYVITSGRSASASEVVINSLKPYMDVYIVGERTVGKDAGSVTLYEEDNPANKWAIQPIVVKLVNKDGEDYPNGFSPDFEQQDNFLVLEPLGSIDEPLLNIALAVASGGEPARLGQRATYSQRPVLHSIDAKVRSNRFILKQP